MADATSDAMNDDLHEVIQSRKADAEPAEAEPVQ